MATSILSLIGTSFFGAVAFSAKNEVTNRACWVGLKVKDAAIDSSASTTSNPIHTESDAEDSTVSDLRAEDISTIKIFNPSRIHLTAFADNLSDVDEVISTFMDQTITLTISTKGIMAKNMVVSSVDIIQSQDGISMTALSIELEQALPPTVQSSFNPAQSSDASAYGVSIQNPPVANNTPLAIFEKLSISF